MPWFDPELVEKAKEMDLFTYLSIYEPNELVHVSGNEYTTRTHDSLRISNGKWHWCSQGGGGRSAIQYLIKVRGMEFIPAVKLILSGMAMYPVEFEQAKAKLKTKPKSPFALPEEYPTTKRVRAYLLSRGIHANVIDSCIRAGTLYESAPYHNAVFVGKDMRGEPRFACMRGTSPAPFKMDVTGSDKRFAFRIPAAVESDRLRVFEGAIDLLSDVTLSVLSGKAMNTVHRIILSGVAPAREGGEKMVPLALQQYLADHPEVKRIELCLDNDEPGRHTTGVIASALKNEYEVLDIPAPLGNDYNDFLMQVHPPLKKEHVRSGMER